MLSPLGALDPALAGWLRRPCGRFQRRSPERIRGLRSEPDGQPAGNRRGGRQYAVTGKHLLVGVATAVPHADAVPVLDHLTHLGAEDDTRTKTKSDRLGQRGGPSNDVAG